MGDIQRPREGTRKGMPLLYTKAPVKHAERGGSSFHDIVNNLTSESGREIAFTQGQRYVSLSRLQKGPNTTSELIEEFAKPEEAIRVKSGSDNGKTDFVYEDFPTNSAKMHLSRCSYCNNGKGFQSNRKEHRSKDNATI